MATRMIAAGAVLLAAACSDLVVPDETTLNSADLLFLRQQTAAPFVSSELFWLSNARGRTITLRHDDDFNTVFAEVTFRVGSILRSGGQEVGPNDSVQVAITPSPIGYSLLISPASMEFSSLPSILFSASVYGDFSVADDSQRYTSRDEYFQNLQIWTEITLLTWQAVQSTRDGVRTTVSANPKGGGRFSLGAAQ